MNKSMFTHMDHILKKGRHPIALDDLSAIWLLFVVLFIGALVFSSIEQADYRMVFMAFYSIFCLILMVRLVQDFYRKIWFISLNTNHNFQENRQLVETCFRQFKLLVYYSRDGKILFSRFLENEHLRGQKEVYVLLLDGQILINFRSTGIFNFLRQKECAILAYLKNLSIGSQQASADNKV